MLKRHSDIFGVIRGRKEGRKRGRERKKERDGEDRWQWCIWVQGGVERGRWAHLVGRSLVELLVGESGDGPAVEYGVWSYCF